MMSGTVYSLLLLFLSYTPALAQTQQVQFNQVLNVNGDVSSVLHISIATINDRTHR